MTMTMALAGRSSTNAYLDGVMAGRLSHPTEQGGNREAPCGGGVCLEAALIVTFYAPEGTQRPYDWEQLLFPGGFPRRDSQPCHVGTALRGNAASFGALTPSTG